MSVPFLGGASSLVDSAINGAFSLINTSSTNKANKEMAEYQYAKNVEMWEKANAYNNPSSQMSRLKEAGLNPNLVYGNGSVVGNTSTQTPQYQAPRLDYDYKMNPGIAQALSSYQDLSQKSATVDNLREQSRNIIADTLLKSSQMANLTEQNAQIKATTAKTESERRMSDFNLQQAQRLSDYSVQAASQNVRNMTLNYDKTQSEIAKNLLELSNMKYENNLRRFGAEKSGFLPRLGVRIIENMKDTSFGSAINNFLK